MESRKQNIYRQQSYECEDISSALSHKESIKLQIKKKQHYNSTIKFREINPKWKVFWYWFSFKLITSQNGNNKSSKAAVDFSKIWQWFEYHQIYLEIQSFKY